MTIGLARKLPMLLVALAAVFLIACSNGTDQAASTDEAAEQTAASEEATVASDEHTDDEDADHEDGDHEDADSDQASTSGGHAHADGGQIALTMAAIDAADTAGFHGMQEELEAGGEINDRWASKVSDTLATIQATPWDESLAHGVEGMVAALEQFQAGLESGDAAAALEGAVAVHEAQHHFGPEVYAWLSEQNAGHDEPSTLVTGLAAIDIIDSSGFHGMGEAISEAGEISGRYQRAVTNALAALNAASWPEDAEAGEEALAAALEQTAAAMEAGDVDGALAGLDAVHDAQHDLSHGFYGWLAANHADIDHSDPNVARSCTLKSVDMVNSVGLHGMAEDLETAEAINDRYAGQIEKMVAIFAGASHHGDAAQASEHMHMQLESLETALKSDDIAAAREAAGAAHEAQHDLSHDVFAWIAANPMHASGGHDGAAGDAYGDEGASALADAEVDAQVTVQMLGIAFDPTTVTVKAGEVVELTVENTIDILHDFTIDEMDADVYKAEAAGHSHGDVGGGADDAVLHVGLEEAGTSTVRFRVHEPGEYTFYCTVPGHREAGMTGTLVVTE